MKWFKLSATHKAQYALCKLAILVLMIIMMFVSFEVAGVDFPTVESQLSMGIGFMGVLFVFVLAIFNRISSLFKIKSLGFVIMFLILMAVRQGIDLLVWSIGLMSIPLVIDDCIITPIWLNIWYRDYDA